MPRKTSVIVGIIVPISPEDDPNSVPVVIMDAMKDHMPCHVLMHNLIEEQDDPDPIPEESMELRWLRDSLITGRNAAINRADFGMAVLVSHLIAAINTGCIIQVKPYIPGGD